MLERFLTGASTYSPSIDHLMFLIAALVGFWLIVAEVCLFWLIYKYRHKEGRESQYVTGEEKHLKRWVTVPHTLVILCDILIIVAAVRVWINVKQSFPAAQATVRIFSQQWAWSFQQPGADGVLDTGDDILTVDELHVKINTTYYFELRSRDVVHSFAVPSFRLKQDAVPGRVITGWFRADRVGTYDIQCTQICGVGHAFMAGRVIVETPEQHAEWIKRASNPALAAHVATGISATEGSQIAEVRP